MRLKISNVVVIVGIFIICAATSSPTFADTPGKDACLLLTQAQVSEALGMAFDTGSHVNPQFLQTCTWILTGNCLQAANIPFKFFPPECRRLQFFCHTTAQAESALKVGAQSPKKCFGQIANRVSDNFQPLLA